MSTHKDANQRKEMNKWLAQLDPGLRAALEGAYKSTEIAEATADKAGKAKLDAAQDKLIKTAKAEAEAKGKAGKASSVTVDDDKAQVVAQKPLGALHYRGRNFTLWALTDPSGAVAHGGKGPAADLAKMNEYGAMAIKAATDLNSLESEWRQKVEVVHKAAAQSAVEIKKVEAALPAMRTLRGKNRAVFADVHAFTDALKNAEAVIGRIRSAEKGLSQAASALKSSEFWKQASDQEDKVDDAKKAVADKEEEMKEAKRIAGGFLDVLDKIVHQEWSALASKALEFARDKALDAAVEAQFGKDLADLKAKLATAEGELKKLKKSALSEAVEAARAGVEKALIDLANAKKDFNNALEQAAQLQTNANDTLKKSPSTAELGLMITQRSKQLADMDAARTACERYGRISTLGRERMTVVSNKYGTVGTWLNDAAKADPAFDRSKPYAKILERSALGNAIELGRWDDWIGSGVQGECKAALTWLGDTSEKGPIAHFERAIEIAKKLQVDTP